MDHTHKKGSHKHRSERSFSSRSLFSMDSELSFLDRLKSQAVQPQTHIDPLASLMGLQSMPSVLGRSGSKKPLLTDIKFSKASEFATYDIFNPDSKVHLHIQKPVIETSDAGYRRFNLGIFNPHPFPVTKIIELRSNTPHIRMSAGSGGKVECQSRPAYKHIDTEEDNLEPLAFLDVLQPAKKQFIITFVAELGAFGFKTFIYGYNEHTSCEKVSTIIFNANRSDQDLDTNGYEYLFYDSYSKPEFQVQSEGSRAVFDSATGRLTSIQTETTEAVPVTSRQVNMRSGKILKTGDEQAKIRFERGLITSTVSVYSTAGITRYNFAMKGSVDSEAVKVETYSNADARDEQGKFWSLEIGSSKYAVEKVFVSGTGADGEAVGKLQEVVADSSAKMPYFGHFDVDGVRTSVSLSV